MRKWEIAENTNYKYEVLSGMTLEFSHMTYHINPAVIGKLIKGNYDIIIVSGYSDFTSQAAFVVSKLLNKPTIVWTEGIAASESFLGKLLSPVTNFMVKNADAMIVPGTVSRNFMISKGLRTDHIFIAPNIVDNEKFIEQSSEIKGNIEAYKRQLHITNKKLIIYVGRIVREKGIEYLLNAYKKIKDETNDVGLILVGDGNLKPGLEKLCLEEDIRDVYFTGWLEDKKIIYYSISDLFVLPTLKDLCPLVINESMCCGLPVITTDAAGCAHDMVQSGENGFIVNVASTDELYHAIKKVVTNDGLSLAMGKKSLEIIKTKYRINNAVEGFTSAITYAVNGEQ